MSPDSSWQVQYIEKCFYESCLQQILFTVIKKCVNATWTPKKEHMNICISTVLVLSFSLVTDPEHILKTNKDHWWYLILSKIINLLELTLSNVSFVYEAWQHMTVLYTEVVVGTKHIGGNHSCIAMPVLFEIRPVKHTHSIKHNTWDYELT